MAKNDEKAAPADKAAEEAATKAKADAEEKAKKDTEAKQAQAEPAEESTEGLVKMHKDGEGLHVHPTTVEAHKAAGWKHA